jgi:RNA polymerase sigma-70 factor (ECF subfamily)
MPPTPPSDELETRLRAMYDGGDFRGLATAAIQAYGPEILGYVYAVARDEQVASEVFSAFLEDVWRGLPEFAWLSAFRTWAYAIARNALLRQFRDGARRRRHVRLSDAGLDTLAVQIRTTTLPHLRSELKDRAKRLRDQLDPDEQTLLILRVDRRMTWPEIAAVMNLAGSEPTRAAAMLRKRYERIIARLREQSASTPR